MQQFYLEDTVTVGDNVTIEPFAVVKGNTVLRDGCVVGSFSYINNADIGRNAVIAASYICDSTVGENCFIGPYARLRSNAVVEDGCKVGNFVEIKNSRFGCGSKASHLAYVGDADVGKRVNVGCGVIFVNYDGQRKCRSIVGDDCFLGCNSNIIAPVTVGEGCYIACNTTVTSDVNGGAFVIGRSKMTVKEDGAKKYLTKKPRD